MADRLGSAKEGSQPLFLDIGGTGEAEPAGEGRLRVARGSESPARCFGILSRASESSGAGIGGMAFAEVNGFSMPGTDSLNVKGKGMRVVNDESKRSS